MRARHRAVNYGRVLIFENVRVVQTTFIQAIWMTSLVPVQVIREHGVRDFRDDTGPGKFCNATL
jgi:hypothetical protein